MFVFQGRGRAYAKTDEIASIAKSNFDEYVMRPSLSISDPLKRVENQILRLNGIIASLEKQMKAAASDGWRAELSRRLEIYKSYMPELENRREELSGNAVKIRLTDKAKKDRILKTPAQRGASKPYSVFLSRLEELRSSEYFKSLPFGSHAGEDKLSCLDEFFQSSDKRESAHKQVSEAMISELEAAYANERDKSLRLDMLRFAYFAGDDFPELRAHALDKMQGARIKKIAEVSSGNMSINILVRDHWDGLKALLSNPRLFDAACRSPVIGLIDNNLIGFRSLDTVSSPKIVKFDPDSKKFILNGVPSEVLFRRQLLALVKNYLHTEKGANDLIDYYERNIENLRQQLGISGKFAFSKEARQIISSRIMAADISATLTDQKPIVWSGLYVPSQNLVKIDTLIGFMGSVVGHEFGHASEQKSGIFNESMNSLINRDIGYPTAHIVSRLKFIKNPAERKKEFLSTIANFYGFSYK